MKTQAKILVVTQFVLFALLAGVFMMFPPGQVAWARWLGALLTLAGLSVVAVALLTYMQVNRKFVNVSPEPNAGHELVQVGIYGTIRHPIYTGVILTAFGTALAHGHAAGLLIAALICAFFTYMTNFTSVRNLGLHPCVEIIFDHSSRGETPPPSPPQRRRQSISD